MSVCSLHLPFSRQRSISSPAAPATESDFPKNAKVRDSGICPDGDLATKQASPSSPERVSFASPSSSCDPRQSVPTTRRRMSRGRNSSSPVSALLLLLVMTGLQPRACESAITEQCLACICHASSGCDSSLKCHNDGNGGYFCGPYQISWAYWADAGKMGSRGGDHDFENCLNNKICAEATIVAYMNKYASDCNQDGSIDCNDFAAIHKSGPGACDSNSFVTSAYWKKFEETPCYRTRNPDRSSRDFFLEEVVPPRARLNGFTPANNNNNNNRGSGRRIDAPPVGPDRSFRGRGANQPFVNRAPNARVSWAFNHTRGNDDPLGIINEAANFFANADAGPTTGAGSFFPPQPPPRPPNRVPVNDRRLPSPASFRPSVDRRRFEEPPVNSNNNNNGFENFNARRPNNVRNNGPPLNAPPVNNNFRPPVNPVNRDRAIGPRLLDSPPRNFSRPAISGSAPFNGPFRPSNVPNRQPVRPVQPRIEQPPPQPRPAPPVLVNNERAIAPVPPNGPAIVAPQCLRCLCAASTGCDLNRPCIGDHCGPFLISWNYWSDAGRPGKDFVSCALNRACSEEAIQGYMRKWTRDCNGDGIVDCDDFAAIHKLGPHMCRSEAITSTAYWREYEKCDSSVRPGSPAHVGSPSVAVGDLRRPERGFNDIPILPDHERRGPPPPPQPPGSGNNGNLNFNPNINNNAALTGNRRSPLSFPPPFFFNNDGSSAAAAASVTTPRPPLDLPLITPRRRLYAPSAAPDTLVPGPSAREGRSNDVVGGNLIDSGKPTRQELTKECMECICDASSGCNLQATCPLDGGASPHLPKTCGPYQFDRNYWTLSGRPGRSFESCANEKACSEETVGRFTHQMSFDCNEDGVIDCLDYASIHRVGPKSCNSQWFLDSPYWSSFEQCYGFGRK